MPPHFKVRIFLTGHADLLFPFNHSPWGNFFLKKERSIHPSIHLCMRASIHPPVH
jgi:hypothetical protein